MTDEDERAAIAWLRTAVGMREAGVQRDKRHHERSRRPFDVERERNYATLPSMTLSHAMILLRLAEAGAHLEGEGMPLPAPPIAGEG